MARLLCLKAAWMMDTEGGSSRRTGSRRSRPWHPTVALKVIDEAIQMHGGQGISQDTPLAGMYMGARTLRLPTAPTPCIAWWWRAASSRDTADLNHTTVLGRDLAGRTPDKHARSIPWQYR